MIAISESDVGNYRNGRLSSIAKGRPVIKVVTLFDESPCRKKKMRVDAGKCRVSSAVEQRFCKPLVGSSILSPGTSNNNSSD
jgi:hypothetical protein